MAKRKDVALVLASGGARGFAHVGVIRVLEKYGFNIHSVAGASMGSLIGGMYCTGELENFIDFMDTVDLREMLKYIDINLGPGGMIKGDKVIAKLKELIPDRDIEDLNIPYCAIATDIKTGDEKVFKSGKLYDAIRASISIPAVFTPHVVDGHYYVDGGVVNPLPTNRIHRKRGDMLIAVSINDTDPDNYTLPIPAKDKKRDRETPEALKKVLEKVEKLFEKNNHKNERLTSMNITDKTVALMINQMSMLTLQVAPADIEIHLPIDSYSSFDFYKAKEIIAYGEAAAEKAVQAYLNRKTSIFG